MDLLVDVAERLRDAKAKAKVKLEGRGIKPIVVKGQVIAQEYEEPLARQSGDIDVR